MGVMTNGGVFLPYMAMVFRVYNDTLSLISFDSNELILFAFAGIQRHTLFNNCCPTLLGNAMWDIILSFCTTGLTMIILERK